MKWVSQGKRETHKKRAARKIPDDAKGIEARLAKFAFVEALHKLVGGLDVVGVADFDDLKRMLAHFVCFTCLGRLQASLGPHLFSQAVGFLRARSSDPVFHVVQVADGADIKGLIDVKAPVFTQGTSGLMEGVRVAREPRHVLATPQNNVSSSILVIRLGDVITNQATLLMTLVVGASHPK